MSDILHRREAASLSPIANAARSRFLLGSLPAQQFREEGDCAKSHTAAAVRQLGALYISRVSFAPRRCR
jgi:hypothetical protein